MFPVAPGVHRIPLPMPTDGLVAVNVYAVEDGDRLVLVDGGWAVPEARSRLDEALAALDADVRAVSRILVTHAHRDHYTMAIQLRRELGTRVGLGAGEAPSLAALSEEWRASLQARRDALSDAGAGALLAELETLGGAGDPPEYYEAPDEWLEAGRIELVDRVLEVVPTPGHTAGHVVFRDAAGGLLFAGDHVLPHITPSIGFEPVPTVSPLRDFLSSLGAIRRLADTTLLPAHGAPGPSVHARIDELVAHHDARLAQMRSALGDLGSATAAEVAAAVGWTRRQRSFAELDVFNRMLAVTETVAHLTVLAETGLVRRSGGRPVRYSTVRDGDAAS